jgi:hypothetical protein
MKNILTLLVVALLSLSAGAARAEAPTPAEIKQTATSLKSKAELKKFFASSYGYAVFPRVGRGAVGIGGAFGEGGVFKGGKMVGKSTLSQVTIGLGLGGEQYTEIVFFKDKKSYDRFVEGNVEFDAHATAVAADKGVGGALGYNNGVAIFTFTKGGLMADASVGGQKFTFEKL